MVLAVPPANLPILQELCDTFDTELTNIGEINDSGRLIVRYDGNQVLNLSNKFLHEGIPQRELEAVIHEITLPTKKLTIKCAEVHPEDMLIQLLGQPNIASKAGIIHLYDHEVQGGTVIKPLTGLHNDGPSDAAVIKPARTHSNRGLVISNGINPEYGKRDAYRMAWSVIDEAIRNAVAAGADPERIAILDNFCWGDPRRPETLGTLVEAVRGCHDAAIHYKSPFISGKDSLNNEFTGMDGHRHAIPPTLLISALGQIEDVSLAVSMDLKIAGNIIYLVGDFQPVFGGSHYALISGCLQEERIPAPSEIAIKVYGGLHAAIRSGSVRAAHDLSEGGLSVSAAEMCVAGRLGMDLSLPNEGLHFNRVLFGETNGCLLVEVPREHKVNFEKLFTGLPIMHLGLVTDENKLNINSLSVAINDLVKAWTQGSL
jgi:phosphoribosylformylglycinamidine synthase